MGSNFRFLVPRLRARSTLPWRLLPPVATSEAGASGQCVPGLELRNEKGG